MSRKILVVDDDLKTRNLLKAYLEKQQYEVRVAHDGASFLAEFERLRDLLPPETALLVGGRAMNAYRDVVEKAGAVPVESLVHLGSTLDGLRSSRQPTNRTAKR